jgi:hypothetical protein
VAPSSVKRLRLILLGADGKPGASFEFELKL